MIAYYVHERQATASASATWGPALPLVCLSTVLQDMQSRQAYLGTMCDVRDACRPYQDLAVSAHVSTTNVSSHYFTLSVPMPSKVLITQLEFSAPHLVYIHDEAPSPLLSRHFCI
jgi:hypothetical protein